jgi:porin
VSDEPKPGADTDFAFRVSALAPFGGDLSGTRLGDLQGATNIAAYNHPLLYELWLAGTFADGRLGLRAGRLVADGDFATTASGGVFLNSSFGWPAFISANTRNTGPAFNRSALGLFVTVQPRAGLLLQAGVYDGDSFDDAGGDPSRHPHGLRVELSRAQGAFALAEIVLTTAAGPADAPRPGSFKLGAWHHTADFTDSRDPTRLHAGNHGVYVVAEQMLWREPGTPADDGQGLTFFARTGFAPGDRNRFTQTADAGLSLTGLLPGRDADTCGLGVAWVRLGQPFRQAERATGAAVVSDYELVVEASYDCALSERWHLIPDLQWIRHPGGSPILPDALVLGLRTRLTF